MAAVAAGEVADMLVSARGLVLAAMGCIELHADLQSIVSHAFESRGHCVHRGARSLLEWAWRGLRWPSTYASGSLKSRVKSRRFCAPGKLVGVLQDAVFTVQLQNAEPVVVRGEIKDHLGVRQVIRGFMCTELAVAQQGGENFDVG